MNRQQRRHPVGPPLQFPAGVMPEGVMEQPAPVQMQLVQPLNDTQFVGLLAAHVYGAGVLLSPQQAVDKACELTAWCIVAMNTGRIPEWVKKIQASMPKPPVPGQPAKDGGN